MNMPNNAELQIALQRLREGELVVVPTETVYGLAADAENPQAVANVFALKGRPATRPLIVHIADVDELEHWALDIPAYAYALARAFWPGPLSLVLKRGPRVPDAVTGGQDTVALRVPAHPLMRKLLASFGGAVAAPSANRYGRISPTTPAHARDEFGDATPFILDGGPCTGGIESTIVSCLNDTPCILRPGLIAAAEIENVTGFAVREQVTATNALRTAGQDASHYAPRTPTFLVEREQLAEWKRRQGQLLGFLGFAPPGFGVELDLRLSLDPLAAARELYSRLRELDAAGLDALLIEAPPRTPSWAGVRDRLQRASSRE